MVTKIKKQIIIHCFGPTNFIAALGAIETLHLFDDFEVTVAINWPGISVRSNQEILKVVKQLSRPFPFVKKIIPFKLEMKFPGKKFTEIYYPHDVDENPLVYLRKQFPRAKVICYGDAFGFVFQKEYHLSFLENNSFFSRLKKKFYQKQDSSFKPDQAVLILPIDQSGNFLKNVPLEVVSKAIVGKIISQCADMATNLNVYLSKLNKKFAGRKKYLILTENFAEGGFIDFEKEIGMWCDIVKKYCPKDSVVFLKSHPAETLPRNQKIKQKLKDYQIIELDKTFKRYPIEIWQGLVRNCTIICMSTPVLSLKYLYNLDVSNPMDKKFLRQWFPKWTRASYENSTTLYMEPLKDLPNWDGKSILWSPGIKRK